MRKELLLVLMALVMFLAIGAYLSNLAVANDMESQVARELEALRSLIASGNMNKVNEHQEELEIMKMHTTSILRAGVEAERTVDRMSELLGQVGSLLSESVSPAVADDIKHRVQDLVSLLQNHEAEMLKARRQQATTISLAQIHGNIDELRANVKDMSVSQASSSPRLALSTARTSADGEAHTDPWTHFLSGSNHMHQISGEPKSAWGATPPALIKAFREGKLDWHDLMPQRNANLGVLALKKMEDQLVELLVSGLRKDHGPFARHAMCPILGDRCIVIDTEEDCYKNSFCAWSPSGSLCLAKKGTIMSSAFHRHLLPVQDRFGLYDTSSTATMIREEEHAMLAVWLEARPPLPTRPPPITEPDGDRSVETLNEIQDREFTSKFEAAVRRGKVLRVVQKEGAPSLWVKQQEDLSQCEFMVWEPVFLLQTKYLQMFYHLLMDNVTPAQIILRRGGHVVIDADEYDGDLFEWFGLASGYCYQDKTTLPINSCFFDAAVLATDYPILPAVKPESVPPDDDAIQLSIISRKNKRFILNEEELVVAAEAMGLQVRLLALEWMTAHEQTIALSSSNILFGIHGSGLTNIRFLPRKNCVMAQVIPFGMTNITRDSVVRSPYMSSSRMAQCGYVDYEIQERSDTVLHAHFLPHVDDMDALDEVVHEQLQTVAGEFVTRTFWLNQDVNVPVDAFVELMEEAVEVLKRTRRT